MVFVRSLTVVLLAALAAPAAAQETSGGHGEPETAAPEAAAPDAAAPDELDATPDADEPTEAGPPAEAGDASASDSAEPTETQASPGDVAAPKAIPPPDPGSFTTAPAEDDDPLYNDESRYNPDGTPKDGAEQPTDDADEDDGKKKKKKKKRKKKKKKAEETEEDDEVKEPRVDEGEQIEGLSGWAIWPIQVGSGCLMYGVLGLITSPIAALPVIGIPLRYLVIWAVLGTTMATIGDGFGKTRGAIGWPMIAGFCTDLGCTSVAGVVTLLTWLITSALFGGGALLALSSIDTSSVDGEALAAILLGSLGLAGIITGTVATLLFGGAQCASLNAASATYQLAADDKKDDQFRFPGFFSPNHEFEPDVELEIEEDEEVFETWLLSPSPEAKLAAGPAPVRY